MDTSNEDSSGIKKPSEDKTEVIPIITQPTNATERINKELNTKAIAIESNETDKNNNNEQNVIVIDKNPKDNYVKIALSMLALTIALVIASVLFNNHTVNELDQAKIEQEEYDAKYKDSTRQIEEGRERVDMLEQQINTLQVEINNDLGGVF